MCQLLFLTINTKINVIFDTPINYGLKILDPNSITVAVYLIFKINLDIMQCYQFTAYRLLYS